MEEKDIKKIDGKSFDVETSEKEKLKAVFPQCFIEGKLDIDKLQSLCGEYIDNDRERYKFEWKGKLECYRIAGKRSTGTLRPCPEESVNFENTNNLYIEGDNLEVLKLLQSTYYRKVKMIYIDPPYNTGNDFIYKDDFKDPIAKYKEITSQTTKSNPETMGHYHTNWLNMMYPRLRLAANLLCDDGVIFISIDDNEQHNLRKLCDEVFGEENFIGEIIWNSTKSVTNTALISVSHTYNLVYAKTKDYYIANREEFRLKEDGEGFSNPDNDPRGPWKADPFQVGGWRPNQQYDIINPKTGKVYKPNPACSWKNDYNKFQELIKDNRIVFGTDGTAGPQRKRFLSEATERGKVTKTLWDDIETTTNGTQLLKKLLGGSYFDNPKPVSLIKRMLELSTKDSDIILDFFSGSATTAHAVMQLNAEDGGKRQFIMVQLPEITDENSEAYKAGYKNICEIGKERIRRAGTKIKEEYNKSPIITTTSSYNMEKMELSSGHHDLEKEEKHNKASITESRRKLDTGFKVLKLDSSNLVKWDDTPTDDTKILKERFDTVIKTLKIDRSELDIVYEVMLKLGIPLTYQVNEREINSRKVYSIGENNSIVFICLDGSNGGIIPEDVSAMCALAPAKIVIAEDAFKDDIALSNAYYISKDKGIKIELL